MTENIQVFTQSSIRITSGAGIIYADPFQLRGSFGDAACILITHDHYDHFSEEDILKAACSETILVVPKKMEGRVKGLAGKVAKILAVMPGEQLDIGGVHLETIPAYNILKPFHPKSAGWVGYLLEADGRRIYIAGDTDATAEAKAVRCDIALIPIGGTYTMDAKQAAELINEMRPETAIPIHYGSIVGSPKDGEVFASLVKAPVKVEQKLRF